MHVSSRSPINHKPLEVRNMDILVTFSYPSVFSTIFIVTSACREKITIALSNLISIKDKEFMVNLLH